MAQKITKLKIKQANGDFGSEIPFGVNIKNVDVLLKDGTSTNLAEVGLLKQDVVNDLSSANATSVPLSAAKGKTLNDRCDTISNTVQIHATHLSSLPPHILSGTYEPMDREGVEGDLYIKYREVL